MNTTTTKKLGVIALAGIISSGAATAATSSSKDGMLSAPDQSTNQYVGNELPMLAAGVQEFGLSGHLNWEDSTTYSFDVSYGQFYTPNWLFGVQAGVTGLNSDKDYRLGVFAEYNFLTGTKWVPFIRSGVGYSHPDSGDDGATIGVDVGMKYFMRPNLAIFASMGGDWNISGDSDSDGIAKQVDLGLRFYF